MARGFRRRGSFYIDFNDAQGIRHRRKIGPNHRVAKEALNATLTKIARQEWVGAVDDSKISFPLFAEKVWAVRVLPTLRPKTRTRWQQILRTYLAPAFGCALRSIDTGMVEKYIADRLNAQAKPGTVNREISVLRHILKRACIWKDADGARYVSRYPLDEYKPLEEPAGRTRFLDHDAISRLLAACDDSRSPYLKPFVVVSLNTGMRRGEVLSLTRNSIDWKRRTATLERSKNGDARHIPLNDIAFDALRSLPVRLDGRLWPFKDDHSVSRAFRRAVKRAGIEDFRLHDCRHTFASHHAMNGVQTRGLQALLGHRLTSE